MMYQTTLAVVLGLTGVASAGYTNSTQVNLPGASGPVAYGTPKVETHYTSQSVDTFVATSVINIFAPLDASFPSHSAECDYLSYLRYRHVDGPSNASQADRIMTFMPGTLAGAGNFDQMARNIVYEFNAQGLHGEVWSLDRRANCLEDNTGIQYGVSTQTPQNALDYYYYGAEVNGKKFGGFYGNLDPKLQLLANLGVDQTIKDWYDIVVTEIPDPTYRATKHFASGHSLGGTLTAFFADYDNDGNNKTTADAGYNAAAGLLAFDSIVNTSSAPDTSTLGPLGVIIQNILGVDPVADTAVLVADAGFTSGIIPRSLFTAIPQLDSEVANAASIIGLYAQFFNNTEIKLSDLTLSASINGSAQLLIAQNNSVTVDELANIRVTANALLGVFFGDKTQPIDALRVSCGFANGSSIGPKAGLFTNQPPIGGVSLAAPTDYGPKYGDPGNLYNWINYDEIAADGSNVAQFSPGVPYTNASSEVSDIFSLATTCTAPLDLTEHYYVSLRLTTDSLFATIGSKLAVKTNVYPNGFTKRPSINLMGTEGLAIGMAIPKGNHVLLPGYNHLDVTMANRKQNLGRQELCSISAVQFMMTEGTGII